MYASLLSDNFKLKNSCYSSECPNVLILVDILVHRIPNHIPLKNRKSEFGLPSKNFFKRVGCKIATFLLVARNEATIAAGLLNLSCILEIHTQTHPNTPKHHVIIYYWLMYFPLLLFLQKWYIQWVVNCCVLKYEAAMEGSRLVRRLIDSNERGTRCGIF